MIRCLLLLVLLCCCLDSRGQLSTAFRDSVNQPLTKDSVFRPNFRRAAIQFTLAEVLPFVVDRYVRHADFAQISFQSVGQNLLPSSWTWDDDPFGTNQFGHPYHGSLFFSAFRSNGYSFWQAAPATVAGSYIWETVAEKQYPSTNDFVNTSFGGIILGEMTYRLSNQIINNRTRGFKRQFSEVLALMVNPMNGFSRIVDGKWGRVYGNLRERDSTHVKAEFDIGGRKFNADHHGKTVWYGRIRLLYGMPFENYRTPFSNISINAEFGSDDSSKVNILSVYGSLAGWRVGKSQRSDHLITLSANYDYIHNEAFFYSAQSIKINLFSEIDLNSKCHITSSFGVGPVFLAAVPDPYRFNGRNYDYGAGGGIYANFGVTLLNRLFYRLNYRGGLLKTINGNESHYALHAVSSEFGYHFTNRISFCAEPGYFYLHGYYKSFKDVTAKYPYLRLSVRYSLSFN